MQIITKEVETVRLLNCHTQSHSLYDEQVLVLKNRAGQVSHLLSLSLSLWGGTGTVLQYRLVFQRSDEVASVSRSQASSWSLMIWDLWLERPQRDDSTTEFQKNLPVSSATECALYLSVHLLYVQNRTICFCVLLDVLSEKLLLGLDFYLPCILKCITFRYKINHSVCITSHITGLYIFFVFAMLLIVKIIEGCQTH